MWRASLFRKVFTLDVGEGVFLKRNSGVTTLLRAIVDEAVLTDVQIARPREAFPVIRLAASQFFLEPVEAAVALFAIALDFAIDPFFTSIQGFHRTGAIVNNAERAGEPELKCPLRDSYRVFGIL